MHIHMQMFEGFSFDEAADILETGEAGFRDLLDEAGREIGEVMSTDVLIIEDEPLIAMDLESLVEGLGHNVTGVARTRTEAVKLAAGKRAGIILADISLPTGARASTP
jgi:PleD family two-component response regulator